MKVWIDLSNSPHPLLFAPVARRLEQEGHKVVLTARDNAQTLELAQERWEDVEIIGDQSPRARIAKARAVGDRVARLRGWARRVRPDVALSHNSYAQIVAARSLGIPAVTAMDFEYQPANHLAFRLATRVLLPEALPLEVVERQGARPQKVVRYPGLKEELYVGDFTPDPQVLGSVGLRARPRVLAVVRTPPTRALYHPAENALFENVLRTVCRQVGVVCVALTRHPEQVQAIEAMGLEQCLVPRAAVDSRSLMYAADVMVGAGGTMTREAAVMGIPTWTLFAGRRPAVDLWLESEGRLRNLTQADQLNGLTPRPEEPHSPSVLRRRGEDIERAFVQATVHTASQPVVA